MTDAGRCPRCSTPRRGAFCHSCGSSVLADVPLDGLSLGDVATNIGTIELRAGVDLRGASLIVRELNEEQDLKADPLVALEAAETLIERGDLNGAARTLENLLLNQPTVADAYAAMARIRIARREWLDAMRCWQQAYCLAGEGFVYENEIEATAAQLPDDLDLLHRAFDILGTVGLGERIIATAARKDRGLERALEIARWIAARGSLELDPRRPKELAREVGARLLVNTHLMNAGRVERSLDILQDALMIDPEASSVHIALGEARWAQGDVLRSFEAQSRAVELVPDNASTLFNLGLCHDLGWGDPEAAIPFYERAIEADPTFCHAHYNLGVARMKLGDNDRGIQALSAAAKLEPMNTDALHNLGIAQLRKQQFPEALEAFEAALKICPRDLDTLHQLGITFLHLERIEECVGAIRRALTIDLSYEPARQTARFLVEVLGVSEDSLYPSWREAEARRHSQ